MLGALCRYLRFMGYDTTSANRLAAGDNREDTVLLRTSLAEGRLLLTRDRELAGRAGSSGVLIESEEVLGQVRQLLELGLIDGKVRMNRCSLCNTTLREACECEIRSSDYAPKDWRGLTFFWCERCRKLYWNGSHGRHIAERIGMAPAGNGNHGEDGPEPA
jgi:uncharacterized protein with PIN domain